MPIPPLPDYEGLNKLKPAKLIEKLNENVDEHNRSGGLDLKAIFNVQVILNELAKRQQNRQTQLITWMTIIVTVATVINLFLAWRVYKLTDLMYQLMQQPPR